MDAEQDKAFVSGAWEGAAVMELGLHPLHGVCLPAGC